MTWFFGLLFFCFGMFGVFLIIRGIRDYLHPPPGEEKDGK